MLHTFSVEYIVAELTLMPDSVVVPIEDASAIHLIVLPVTHIILAIDLPIQTTAPLLVSEGIEAIAHKPASSSKSIPSLVRLDIISVLLLVAGNII
jgi:hypothetical protein